MKILFIGCVESSYIFLEELLSKGFNVCGVVTKKQSSFNADFKDLTPLCNKYNVQRIYMTNSKDIRFYDFVRTINPEVIYCFGWSYLIEQSILDIPPLGVIGFHPAKIPYNKGRHPIIWALVLGLTETASSFFKMDYLADNGPLLSQEKIQINENDDAYTLYMKIMNKAVKQMISITEKLEKGTVSFIHQGEMVGNNWRKRSKADGEIDFRMSGKNIYNLVRALTKPYPGAFFEYQGVHYKVNKCEFIGMLNEGFENIEYGKIIKVYSNNSFIVKVGDGLLKITDCDDIIINIGDYL